jgi:hypothetical protein
VLHQVSISGGEELIEQGHFGSANIQERIQEVSLSIMCPYYLFPGLCFTSFKLGVEITKKSQSVMEPVYVCLEKFR